MPDHRQGDGTGPSEGTGAESGEEEITIRWALLLSLLIVLVFALSMGIRMGAEYAEQLIAR